MYVDVSESSHGSAMGSALHMALHMALPWALQPQAVHTAVNFSTASLHDKSFAEDCLVTCSTCDLSQRNFDVRGVHTNLVVVFYIITDTTH